MSVFKGHFLFDGVSLKGFLASTASLAVVCYATGAAAQDAPQPTAPKVSAEQSSEIVVTARRRSERLLDVPVAASVVNAADIRQYGLTSVANIKIVAPQISLDRGFTGSGTSISMRGVSSSSLDAGVEQSVLLDFDGMGISRGRILNDALFDIEGIDVLKGPQALFFGKNSPGGVVSVKSADPTPELGGFLRGGYEFNADNASLEGAVSGPLTDELGFRLAFLGSQSKGYIENQNSGVPDLVRSAATGSTFVPAAPSRLGAEEKMAGRLTLKYGHGNFDANFKLLLSHYEGQGLPSFSEVMSCPASRARPGTTGGVIDPTGDCTLNDKSSQGLLSPTIINLWPEVKKNGNGQPFSRNDTVFPTLTLNYQAGQIALTSVTGYYDYDYVSQGNADATSYSYFWSYSNEKNQSFYQEVRAVSSFDGMLNFAAGGHFESNDRTLYVGSANGPLLPDAATGKLHSYDNQQHNKSDAYSVFGQVIAKLPNNLELTAGGRYTNQSKELDSGNYYVNSNSVGFLPAGVKIVGKKTEDNFSPEATLTWHPAPDLMIYGAYKTGYLSGGFSNPGSLSSISTIKTLSFDSEEAKGYELGAKGQFFDGALTAAITGYRYEYEGLPLTSLIALSATQTTFVTQNAANTLTQGVELEGTYRPMSGTTLRATASYNDAHFEDFPAAQCYAGQTTVTGCIRNPVTGASTQDLSGKAVYRAPEWLLTAGVVQEFRLSDTLNMTVNADLRYTSSYFTGLNLNPLSEQDGFTLFNAGARISTEDDKWSFAIIGRNLTNERYGTLGVDKPGGIGEVYTVAGEPRAIVFQVESKF